MNELKLGGMYPVSGYHTGGKPLAFVGHARGKIPTFGHYVGKKPTDGYLFEHSLFCVSRSLKNETDIIEHSSHLSSLLKTKKGLSLVFAFFVLWFKHEKDI